MSPSPSISLTMSSALVRPSSSLPFSTSALSFAGIFSIQECFAAVWNAFLPPLCGLVLLQEEHATTECTHCRRGLVDCLELSAADVLLFHLWSNQLNGYEAAWNTCTQHLSDWCCMFTEAVMWVIVGTACNLKWHLNDLALLGSGTRCCDTSRSRRSTSWVLYMEIIDRKGLRRWQLAEDELRSRDRRMVSSALYFTGVQQASFGADVFSDMVLKA